LAEQLLDAANGITLAIEQGVDPPRERNVGRAIVTPVAGTLERPELGELRFPIAQDMLRHAKFRA
jgi:hypothetical protein